jgi:hypothetical protein
VRLRHAIAALACSAAGWLCVASDAAALSPGTDLVVPAAARTSLWVTDLYLLNPGSRQAQVTINWLVRGQANPEPSSFQLELEPEETVVLADVIRDSLGLARAAGAFRIVATEPVVANCRIFARDGAATYGQGLEGVPTAAATRAGSSTHAVGMSSGEAHRTNVYALAGSGGATLELELLDPSGSGMASAQLSLDSWEPFLESVTELFDVVGFADATLLVRVSSGSAVVGASRADNLSSDPTTLASWIPGRHDPLAAGTYFGAIRDQGTAASSGLSLRINGTGEVEAIEFSYRSELCAVLFTAGQDLSETPLPLAELGAGYEFSSSYPGGGIMRWSLELDQQPSQAILTGTLGAVGSSWTGELAACNGNHESNTVEVGVWEH